MGLGSEEYSSQESATDLFLAGTYSPSEVACSEVPEECDAVNWTGAQILLKDCVHCSKRDFLLRLLEQQHPAQKQRS